jgi:hypothetical protein
LRGAEDRPLPRGSAQLAEPRKPDPPSGELRPLETASDAEVMVRSLGEPGAFALVCDRHAAVLNRFLVRRVGAAAADGLLGELFRIALQVAAALGIPVGGPEHHEIFSPAEVGSTTSMVNVYVEEIDAHCARAVAEGARIVMGLEDMFWGDRRYEALDPDGHRWHFGERLADIRRRREQTKG